MNSIRPALTFKMRLPPRAEGQLIHGVLYLQLQKQLQQQFKCTSGLPGQQFRGAQALKGVGPLPGSNLIKPLEYLVATHAHTMTAAGHEGTKMYAITPISIRIGEINRGDFGIHRDLNSPGTIGCIGLPEYFQWTLFMEAMENLAKTGLRYVPLSVIYH